MNKGLFVHLMATAGFVVLMIFVWWGEKLTPVDRALIALLFVALQTFVAAILQSTELYKQKI